jgi:Protein of unknown function (DUF664)
MHAKDILVDAFGRIQEEVHAAVGGLAPDVLNSLPAEGVNSISWLVWHLTRVQDDHVADASGLDQVWLATDWRKRFALDLPTRDTGYGHGPAQVAKVRVDSADLLTGYYDAVHEQTLGFLRSVSASDLDKVIDEGWDPPVTLGVRLVSVVGDDMQHVGQAAYARGLLERAG